ncbi:MAG: asparagine synthetase B [Proteobacteria bacterium]|nr:asparagine synthetase B [Pseudomonadota bacterium]
MTAIAGMWRFDGRPDAGQACTRMLASQAIYGPHDNAQWDDDFIAMGRRLYRTLPEDIYDKQPLIGGGGRYVLVADIRLDNRDELISALNISADTARAMADSQVLLAGIEKWGDGAVERLVGDFAYACWDREKRRLTLARDFIGQKPLHYHCGGKFFAFASMPKGLHTLPDIPFAPNEERIAEFLTLMPETGSGTYFRGIERVEAAHIVIVTQEGITARKYWNPTRERLKLANSGEYIEAFRAHFDSAVRLRLRGAGNKVAAHLSAGLDSSSVAATAAQLMRPSDGKVVAFTSVPREGYDTSGVTDRLGDEGPLSAATAAMHPNMEHVFIRAGSRSPLQDLDRYFYLFERPMLNLCNGSWIVAINDAIRERKIPVLLTGQFGNMTISYNGHELLPELLLRGRWISLARESAAAMSRGTMSWRGVLSQTFAPFVPSWMWQGINRLVGRPGWDLKTYTAIKQERLEQLDLKALARERDLDFSYRPRADGFEARMWVLGRVDLGNYHKGTLAGWGIDQRDPTADKTLVEFTLAVPTEEFFKNGLPRALARTAFKDRLPAAVLEQKKKGYQAIDWHEGLAAARAQLAEEIERMQDSAPATTALDLARMRKLVENWPTGGWNESEVMHPYRLALLRGISTGHFLRRATGGNA